MSYDAFASTFSQSRKNLRWGEIEYFVEYMQNTCLTPLTRGDWGGFPPISILDVGCGNGRFLESLDVSGLPYSYLGIDESGGMIEEARKLHPENTFRVLDMNHLEELSNSGISQKRSNLSANRSYLAPLVGQPEWTVRSQYGERGSGDLNSKDEFFRDSYQFIVFIASFHHLQTLKERQEVLEKTKKLLAPGGVIMMTNWNLLEEQNFSRYEKDFLWNGDFSIKIGAHKRYYHGFTPEELEELFFASGYSVHENRVFEGGRNIVSVISL